MARLCPDAVKESNLGAEGAIRGEVILAASAGDVDKGATAPAAVAVEVGEERRAELSPKLSLFVNGVENSTGVLELPARADRDVCF